MKQKNWNKFIRKMSKIKFDFVLINEETFSKTYCSLGENKK